jgi:ribonuclease VapC
VTAVLDSSVLIALIKGEEGAEIAETALDGGLVSAVVFAECLGKLANLGFDADAAGRRFRRAGLRVASVGDADVEAVVALHALAKRNVSLADRFCLALAMTSGLPCLTADRPWAQLGLPIELRSLR